MRFLVEPGCHDAGDEDIFRGTVGVSVGGPMWQGNDGRIEESRGFIVIGRLIRWCEADVVQNVRQTGVLRVSVQRDGASLESSDQRVS